MPIDSKMSHRQSQFYDLIMMVLLPSSSFSLSKFKFKFYSSFRHELSSTSDFPLFALKTLFIFFISSMQQSHFGHNLVSLLTSLNIRNNLLWRKIQYRGALYILFAYILQELLMFHAYPNLFLRYKSCDSLSILEKQSPHFISY